MYDQPLIRYSAKTLCSIETVLVMVLDQHAQSPETTALISPVAKAAQPFRFIHCLSVTR
jgi:hypothetical protein